MCLCVCLCVYTCLRLGVCASECETLCVFLCLALLCVCESHPLTAAELSLIQLCLLSCLPVASAPQLSSGSASVFPSLLPCSLLSLPLGMSLDLRVSPWGVFSIPVFNGYCLCLYVSTCSVSSFLLICPGYLFVQQTSSHVSHPLCQPLCWCWGPGDGPDLGPALKA